MKNNLIQNLNAQLDKKGGNRIDALVGLIGDQFRAAGFKPQPPTSSDIQIP